MNTDRRRVALVTLLLLGLVAVAGACAEDKPVADGGAPNDTRSDASIHIIDSAVDSGPCDPLDRVQSFYACGLYINAWCDRWVQCCANSETCVRDASNSSITSCVQFQADKGYFVTRSPAA